MKKHLISLFLVTAALTVLAQPSMVGIPELRKADPVYDTLLDSAAAMTKTEETLEKRLADTRTMLADSTVDTNKLSSDIINLETELYSLRSSLEQITLKIRAAEQNWILNNPAEETEAASGKQSANIVYNSVFRDNLSASDYKQLCDAQKAEAGVAKDLRKLRTDYFKVADMSKTYKKADKASAGKIYSSLQSAQAKNDKLAQSIANRWTDVFETKVYLYNIVLDKTDQTELLANMELQMNNVRLRMNETRDMYMYDEAAAYPFQKALLLRYETGLAKQFGLELAADSLNKVMANSIKTDSYMLPKIEVEERLFLDFANISVFKTPKYNNTNPIPATEIHPKGAIYRVLLGVYSKPQPISTFKGIYPLSVERKSTNKKYYYYAGGFATYEEATAATAKAKKAGVANPRVVMWVDGVYYAEDATAKRSVGPDKTANGTRYRIEITGAGKGLSDKVRSTLKKEAPGKEISRSIDQKTGEAIFRIGSFDNMQTAEKIVREVRTVAPELSVKILPVQ